MANAALRVSVKTPLAAISCLRGTTCGIIAASAGAKNTVTVEMAALSRSRTGRLAPAARGPEKRARSTFVRDQDDALVEAVHVDAGHGGEEHGRARGRRGSAGCWPSWSPWTRGR